MVTDLSVPSHSAELLNIEGLQYVPHHDQVAHSCSSDQVFSVKSFVFIMTYLPFSKSRFQQLYFVLQHVQVWHSVVIVSSLCELTQKVV